MPEIQRTGLYNAHLRSNAKIISFAGWEMPIQYTSVRSEHNAVRNDVGIFDVSHMGEILISGPDALPNIQQLVSNNVAKIKPNRAIYTGLLYPEGTFVDDLLVYRLSEDTFLLVVNAANTKKDFDWINDHLTGNVTCENVSDQYSQIAVQGPQSLLVMQSLTKTDLSKIRYYRFRQAPIAGANGIISRTGYTGEFGFEFYFDVSKSDVVWDAVLEAGQDYNLKPVGLASRDTLRLEAGMALYGNDIDDKHTALEAGLDWTVKFTKGDFIGKSALQKQRETGLNRHLIGFELLERGIPRKGYKITANDTQIGEVTSGTMSITLNKPIGMGYVKSGFEEIGSKISVIIRGKHIKAKVVPMPFYSRTRL